MKKPNFVERAEQRVDEHTEPAHGQKYATHDGPLRDSELEQQQYDEMQDAWAGPGLPAMTDAQWKGGVLGSLVGGLIGAVLFLPFAFVSMGNLGAGWRILIVAIIGALAGGTAGALYLGGREPELEGEVMDADGRPADGTSNRDPHTDARGRAARPTR
jgi:hypothetical protein